MPLFEDQEEDMIEKPTISIRCDEDFKNWLAQEVIDLGTDISKLTRAALILAIPQIKALRGLDRVDLEDIRGKERIQ